ncbi:MAG TPA: hypothetical protein VJK51_01850 [Candidatus Nanoarchaeia archaeon]|nr:hypothetical protein [Candidatus Nanoarchaeia archaeon]
MSKYLHTGEAEIYHAPIPRTEEERERKAVLTIKLREEFLKMYDRLKNQKHDVPPHPKGMGFETGTRALDAQGTTTP